MDFLFTELYKHKSSLLLQVLHHQRCWDIMKEKENIVKVQGENK
jgi:hypothetical protein